MFYFGFSVLAQSCITTLAFDMCTECLKQQMLAQAFKGKPGVYVVPAWHFPCAPVNVCCICFCVFHTQGAAAVASRGPVVERLPSFVGWSHAGGKGRSTSATKPG